MAKDDVSIANLALGRAGVSLKLDSLTPPFRTKEAVEVVNVFEEVRERVLSAAPWPFARRVQALQKTGTAPVKWKYRYEYPNNCVAIRGIYPPIPSGFTEESYRQLLQELKTPYELETADDGSITICTDQDLAVIEYTMKVINPLRYDARFTSAFAWAICAEIALPLAKGIEFSRNAAAAYEKEIAEATAKALNEEKRPDPPDSEFVRARL